MIKKESDKWEISYEEYNQPNLYEIQSENIHVSTTAENHCHPCTNGGSFWKFLRTPSKYLVNYKYSAILRGLAATPLTSIIHHLIIIIRLL